MVGGRVGKDGIHGATFSSEALDPPASPPVTAVQIGDPITQKKFSDVIVKEARDLDLYRSITDNGAGGISCSVAEMARESGGCHVLLDRVPLKYPPGMAPWEIWISESQERMTLAVPEEKIEAFMNLMKRREVEATVIGTFTDTGGRCVVEYNGEASWTSTSTSSTTACRRSTS
ncbi:AIR synthase-related protein [Methanoculleus chikugoensis]|uniref:AIR synthase-related protein n=1 Tax=Methanoculleus chikugoensis TaxID=118126 RepID=UPI001FB2D544|nr:AIR synthase-related protein [Methanoculleus chikugoensis]